MKIPWAVYAILGLIVIVTSSLIDGMQAFIIIGVFFLFMGLVRFMTRPKSMPEREPRTDAKYVKCPSCKAWNYPTAKHCHYCKKMMP